MPTEAEIYGALTEIFRDVFMRDDLALNPDLSAKDVPGWELIQTDRDHHVDRGTVWYQDDDPGTR